MAVSYSFYPAMESQKRLPQKQLSDPGRDR
jgi:hypothetical protein